MISHKTVNLVIDIGNTLVKLAVFQDDNIIHTETSEIISSSTIDLLYRNFNKINQSIISTVSDLPLDVIGSLAEHKIRTVILDSQTSLPFTVKYKTPETLGKDRIAAVAGASILYDNHDILVIDAGTAITFDLINKNNEYLGGNISPGLDMRFKALNHFTAKLPLLKPEENFALVGDSTHSAIINGVQNGLIFEIEGYIGTLKTMYSELIILLTGGNAVFFELKLKNSIFVVPDLTLIGLNAILNFNNAH